MLTERCNEGVSTQGGGVLTERCNEGVGTQGGGRRRLYLCGGCMQSIR